MNWTKLSAMSEILSFVAILITLVYLSIQTQQNADAIMADTRQEVLASDQQLLMTLMNDPELELIRYKSELTDEEKIRLGFMFLTLTSARHLS